MLEYGDSSGLWLTEIGWTTGPVPTSNCNDCWVDPNRLIRTEDEQAQFLTTSVNLIDTEGWAYVQGFIWNELENCYFASDKCDENSMHSHFGLFHDDLTPKPSASSFQKLIYPFQIFLPIIDN